MKGGIRIVVAVLGACLSVTAVGIARSAAGEGRREKVRRLVEKLEYPQRLRAAVRAELEAKHRGDSTSVDAALAKVKWEPLLDFVADQMETELDDATLDEVLPYLDTPEGKRHLALLRVDRSRAAVDLVILISRASGEPKFERMMEKWQAVFKEATGESTALSGSKLEANETAAIATLRNLAACQAQIQTSGKIDGDEDGIGEYGTFLELTGSVGVRRQAAAGRTDFSVRGRKVEPAIMSPALADVDADGIVVKAGYCFRIFLPDAAPRAGFVHETGPAAKAGLAGGTGQVSTDLSEIAWCAYAWPVAPGESGNRAFFINQEGDLLQSPNAINPWGGTAKAPPGGSAFWRGAGITGGFAVGTVGNDGNIWRVTR